MRYFLCLIACLAAEIVAILLAPAIPLFAMDGWLPRWLWWFQTPDNPLTGDTGHQARWTGRSRYLQQVSWLVRNRAYGFKWGPLGCPALRYATEGDPAIKNRDGARAGWMRLSAPPFWYWKSIRPIGFGMCVQMAFGWQLDAPIHGRCLFMFSPRLTAFRPAS